MADILGICLEKAGVHTADAKGWEKMYLACKRGRGNPQNLQTLQTTKES